MIEHEQADVLTWLQVIVRIDGPEYNRQKATILELVDMGFAYVRFGKHIAVSEAGMIALKEYRDNQNGQ